MAGLKFRVQGFALTVPLRGLGCRVLRALDSRCLACKDIPKSRGRYVFA